MSREIRDPLHGPIPVAQAELPLLDAAAVQRLRRVRQLGFGELTFPGATHTRFLHSLGAMHLAGRAFDALRESLPSMAEGAATRLRWTVRAAALLHDIGHPPLSHQLEYLLPTRAELGLDGEGADDKPARHEDMTRMLLTRGALAETVREAGAQVGATPDDVTAVLFGDVGADPASFDVAGRSLLPLLRALVAGELDCDRMDYLQRDAYFAGVSYGRFDLEWILSNLVAVPQNGAWQLGLRAEALNTFEDFLLSRYHMFLMVYAHPRTLIYDRMLRAFLAEEHPALRFPATVEGYLAHDDGTLHTLLREGADNPWARRILEGRPYNLVLELDEDRDGVPAAAVAERLDAAGIGHHSVAVHTPISKYTFGEDGVGRPPPLLIVQGDRALRRQALPAQAATALYDRYRRTPRLVRFYVDTPDLDAFRALDLGPA